MANIRITTRNRNLGYGATATTRQRQNPITGVTWLEIAEPVESVTGGLATVEHERAEYERTYGGGTDWREALFVGHRRVDSSDYRVRDILRDLREYGHASVRLVDVAVAP